MNFKKTILIPVVLLIMVSCNNQKEIITNLTIDSYVQAVQEEDKNMIIETFPNIIYFKEYPKVDSIILNNYEDKADNVLAKGKLYFTNGFGKKFDKEIELLINTNDSTIIDVLGFLTRKERNKIVKYAYFNSFPDLKPKNNDFDSKYLENSQIALNRIYGFEYYAQKAIGDRTDLIIESSSSIKYSYGIKMGYYNTKLHVTIKNKSDFTVNYDYKDGNYDYNYILNDFINKEKQEYSYETKGNLIIEPNKEISQNIKIKDSKTFEHETNKITVKPIFDKVEDAISVVKKYYNEQTIDSLMSGKTNYWDNSYNFKIKAQ